MTPLLLTSAPKVLNILVLIWQQMCKPMCHFWDSLKVGGGWWNTGPSWIQATRTIPLHLLSARPTWQPSIRRKKAWSSSPQFWASPQSSRTCQYCLLNHKEENLVSARMGDLISTPHRRTSSGSGRWNHKFIIQHYFNFPLHLLLCSPALLKWLTAPATQGNWLAAYQ